MISRNLLKLKSEDLAQSLERSWEIAHYDWLPALGHRNGSYNSFPHLHNLERYLDDLVMGYKLLYKKELNLSAAELYALLAAILFHDIGKSHGSIGHGSISREIIKCNHGELGIYNIEFAYSIGKICEFHAPEQKSYIQNELHTTSVEPFGQIREREIAALLALIDQLDSAYVRVVPYYLISDEEMEIIGRFRREIKSIKIDLVSKMICTCLGDFIACFKDYYKETPKSSKYSLTVSPVRCSTLDTDIKKALNEIVNPALNMINPILVSALNVLRTNAGQKKIKVMLQESDQDLLYAELVQELDYSLRKVICKSEFAINEYLLSTGIHFEVPKCELLEAIVNKVVSGKNVPNDFSPSSYFTPAQYCVMKKLLWPIKNKEATYLPPATILSVILNDLHENVRKLKDLHETLLHLGIDLKGWFIEYDSHIYDENGKEIWEPTMSDEFLLEVIEGMWNLSTTIFGIGPLSYRDLAAVLRKRDEELVKRAVNRIKILTENLSVDGIKCPAIRANSKTWEWLVEGSNNSCRFISKKQIIDLLWGTL
jgi:hypothetical protein